MFWGIMLSGGLFVLLLGDFVHVVGFLFHSFLLVCFSLCNFSWLVRIWWFVFALVVVCGLLVFFLFKTAYISKELRTLRCSSQERSSIICA